MTNGEKIKAMFPNITESFTNIDEYTNKPTRVEISVGMHILTTISVDVWNAEYEEPTTKNDLGVDREQLKNMIRGLTKWYVKRDNAEVGQPNTAVGLLYDDVMFGIDRLPSVTPQEPFINKPCVSSGVCEHDKNKVLNKIRAKIESKCDRINSLASALRYPAHREIQELLCDILELLQAESEVEDGNDD